MPQKSNAVGDLGTTKVASDSYDIDNIYLSEEGWVYRHYKKTDKSKWWDEILVAGEVPAGDSPQATNPPKLGTAASPSFESGDSLNDFEYAPSYGNTVTGGGVPDFTGGGGGGNGGGGGGDPQTSITSVSVGGAANPTEGDSADYSVTVVSDAGNLSYTWLAGNGTINSGAGSTSINVTWGAAGNETVTCTVNSTDENFDGSYKSDTLNIVVAPAPYVGVNVNLNLTGADGTTAYTGNVDGAGDSNNPAVALNVGDTLIISNGSGGHPVIVTNTDGGTSTDQGSISGDNPAGDGQTLNWDTTGATPGTYYYQCQSHAGMIGTITLSAA